MFIDFIYTIVYYWSIRAPKGLLKMLGIQAFIIVSITFYMQKFINYLKGTKLELANVVWPKFPITITHTIIVILVALIVGYVTGLFDGIFKFGIKTLFGL